MHMNTLLVPIDFSSVTKAVVAEAVALAKINGGGIILFHSVQTPTVMADYNMAMLDVVPLVEAAEKTAVERLAHWEKEVQRAGVPVKTILAEGYPSTEILAQAEASKADAIVIGSHGHTAVYDLLVGSATSGVLRKATCPVVVVPARGSKPTRARK